MPESCRDAWFAESAGRFFPILDNHDVALLRALDRPRDEPDMARFARRRGHSCNPGLGTPDAHGARNLASFDAFPQRTSDALAWPISVNVVEEPDHMSTTSIDYLVGGEVGSLAASAFMIRDGHLPGEHIRMERYVAWVVRHAA